MIKTLTVDYKNNESYKNKQLHLLIIPMQKIKKRNKDKFSKVKNCYDLYQNEQSVPSACHVMKIPINADTPGMLHGLGQFLTEIFSRLFIILGETECIADVAYVINGAEFRYTSGQHHSE